MPVIGTPTLLASKVDRVAGATTAVTLATAAGAGHIIVVGGAATNSGTLTLSTVGDTKNTYRVDVSKVGIAAGANIAIAIAKLTTPVVVGDVVTLTWSTSVPAGPSGGKYTGIWNVTGLSGVLDKTAVNDQSGVSDPVWTSTATAATTQADEFVVGGCQYNAATDGSSVPSGSLIEILDVNSGAGDGIGFNVVYQIVSATGAQTAGGTYSGAGSGDFTSAVATYLALPTLLPFQFNPIPFQSPPGGNRYG